MKPDELFQLLCAKANARKVRHLTILNGVCQEQHDRGSKDFSIATIARLSIKVDGPAESTIRNRAGDDYKGLIQAWAEFSSGSIRKPKQVADDPLVAVLSKIPDIAVRSIMGAVIAENRKMRGELRTLKANVNLVLDLRAEAPAAAGDTIEVLPASHGLTASEVSALKYAISPELLDSEGWVTDEHGRVLNSKGRPVQRVGYVSALRKITSGGPSRQ